MFPVDQLQHFQVTSPDHKFIKPWWDTFTDYIATALLMLAVLAGVMQATQSDLVCVPAIDCSLSHNQSFNNLSFNHNGVCKGNKTTMLLKLPDRRLYYYVETVCGRTAVHWFASYFPFIIFLETIILIVVQNFWLKYPVTASIIDHFLSLVIECYNMAWTRSSLKNTLCERQMKQENEDTESRSGDEISENQNASTSASLHKMEGTKANALFEKIGLLREGIENIECTCFPHFSGKIFWIHLFQVIVQLTASIASFGVNIDYHSEFNNNNIICKIDDIIDKAYSYFKCTDGIVSYLEVTNITFCILLGFYIIFCFCNLSFCILTLVKKNEVQNITPNEDMNFLLFLLEKCSKVHFLRFSVFLSVGMKQMLENQILIDKWPMKRLKKIAEDDGRALQLFDLQDGIPETVFKMKELKFLRLENCNPYLLAFGAGLAFWIESMVSISIVRCGLTFIPGFIVRMKSLVKLDLSHNNIETIPQNIGQIKCLRYLDVSYNNISEGVDNLLQIQTLVKLNLRGNDSIELNLNHQQEIKLMKLEISDDVLKEMNEDILSKLENIIVTLPDNDFVIKYSLERAPIMEDMRKNRQCYNMTSNPKGVVAIIDTTADGNEYENLERVFKEIGYNVEKVPQDNFSTIKLFEETLSDLFRGYDSAILIMTAEGYIDGLYLGDELVDIDKIYKCLSKNGLKGKPKLIFLQVDSIAKNPDYIYKPPRDFIYPDTFIAYTVFYEFQGANQFFETLVEVFSNYAWEEDLLSLMRCVKYELSRKFRNKEYEHFHVPKIGGLKKKLYFFPGYYIVPMTYV